MTGENLQDINTALIEFHLLVIIKSVLVFPCLFIIYSVTSSANARHTCTLHVSKN